MRFTTKSPRKRKRADKDYYRKKTDHSSKLKEVDKTITSETNQTNISNSQTAGPSTAAPVIIGNSTDPVNNESSETFNVPRVDYGNLHRPLFKIFDDFSDTDESIFGNEEQVLRNPSFEVRNESSSDETIIYDPPSELNWRFLFNFSSRNYFYPDIPYCATPAKDCYPANWIKKALKFDKIMQRIEWRSCEICKRRFPNLTLVACVVDAVRKMVCTKCQKKPDLFTDENYLDPREQPEVLKNLTMVEQMLIAKVHPVVRLYKIRGQQFGYTGHVVNFEQDISNLHTKLPVNPRNLQGLIIVNRDTPDGIASFQVRAAKIRDALRWLKHNHMYYRDIEINEEQLSQLPDDGNIIHLLPNLNQIDNSEHCDPQIDGAAQSIEESNFPLIPQMNQEERVAEAASMQNITWPNICPEPISEFRTEGYITQAFPTLFPYGRCDFRQARRKSVSYIDYFKFLMQYKDGRFAKDSRFRFFAFNSIMRWQAIMQGNLYVKRNEFGNLDSEAVLERIAANPHLADSIMFYAGKLRSSKSYWYQRSGELHDMVEQLSTPHVFFTLSAADYHWPDLFLILDPSNNIDTSIESNRKRLMHENPLITAWFFQKRAETFMREVVFPCYDVSDYWYRYEWQWRGSPHIHGVLWLKNGPRLTNLDDVTDDQLLYLTNFCARLARAWNPAQTHPPSEMHPSRKRFSEILADQFDLTTIINRLQRHTRHGTHCLRKKRGTRTEECRFGFPHPLSCEDKIVKDKRWKFEPKRNDECLAKFNPFITQIWRGNTDFTPILSKEAVLLYIVKYAAKAETESSDYRDLLKNMAEIADPSSPAASLVRKLLISSTAERDFSAQEVSHLLMGWPLFHSSRIFVTLVIKDESWKRLSDSEPNLDHAIIERYKKRSNDLENLSLFTFARDYRYVAKKLFKRKTAAIVRYFPKFKLTDDSMENEKYYKVKSVLHKPWRNSMQTIIEPFSTSEFPWCRAYNEIRESLGDEHMDLDVEDSFEDDPDVDEFDLHLDPEMAISRAVPHINEPEHLGRREIDVANYWEADCVSPEGKKVLIDWMTLQKQTFIVGGDLNNRATYTLSQDQQKVMDIALMQINDLIQSRKPVLKRIMVQGKAGSGKSYLISALTQKFRENFGQDSVSLLAPTGAAAINISGKTIHSGLNISPRNSKALRDERLRNFQLKMANVKLIIIDEMSMIGLRLLTQISQRLQEAAGNSDEPFGGFLIYLFGDIQQLPPVKNNALYSKASSSVANKGKILVESFQKFLVLTTSHRQAGQSQVQFRAILDGVANGYLTDEQFELLNSRRSGIVAKQELSQFQNAIRLFPKNAMADAYNENLLRRSGNPVALIPATNSSNEARREKTDKAQGLEQSLKLSVGSRVMLRANIWTDVGLVNGALGTLKAIVYERDHRPPCAPIALMIEFDNYQGPTLDNNVIPITPITRHWKTDGNPRWRKQFPVVLAHAITIHKSQGLTLTKAVVNIGDSESDLGSTYVALSRVKNLQSLIIDQIISKDRINNLSKNPQLILRKKFLLRFM